MKNPNWMWLSFADAPDGFRGAVIVRGRDVSQAADEAWRRKINPGGNVAGQFIDAFLHLIPESERNRLLNRAEATALAQKIQAAAAAL